MQFTEEMRKALSQGKTGAAEFVTLWAEQLPAERRGKLAGWLDDGWHLGLHMSLSKNLQVKVSITDANGNVHILEDIEFLHPKTH